MKKPLLASLLASLLAMSLAACGGTEPVKLPLLADVSTFEVSATNGARGRGWDGVVEAVRRADLGAQTAGRVTVVEVDVNDRVAAGDVLVGWVMLAAFLTVLPIFLVMALGWSATRLHLIGERTGEGLSDYVFVIAIPVLLFRSLVTAKLLRY